MVAGEGGWIKRSDNVLDPLVLGGVGSHSVPEEFRIISRERLVRASATVGFSFPPGGKTGLILLLRELTDTTRLYLLP